ncbi:MAG: hypothetical protein MSK40_03645, partial [Parabacteroides sp.]|nr:hypothetical protein [Parabacteroides sp.]
CPGSVQGFFWKSRVVRGRFRASSGKAELSGVGSGLLLEKQSCPGSGRSFFWKNRAVRGRVRASFGKAVLSGVRTSFGKQPDDMKL